jgi:hypothetical protein
VYQLHPSSELVARFRDRPYQGAEPSAAQFLFVGLDANYDPRLEHAPVFRSILDYHVDGVAFWLRHGVHHPFLLPTYRGDGRRYHLTFSRIGFKPRHAPLVSFVELLHVPTVGRSKLVPDDLDARHLQRVNAAIIDGRAEHVFVSAAVARLMRASGVFNWLPREPSGEGPLRTYHRSANRIVYSHLHFSSYGKFQQQLEREASAIASLLPIDPEPLGRGDVAKAAPRPGHRDRSKTLGIVGAAGTRMSPMDLPAARDLLAQAVTTEGLLDAGPHTRPRSWGVYKVAERADTTEFRRYRFGNHPIRQRELEVEFGDVERVALFTSRRLAEELQRVLNAHP